MYLGKKNKSGESKKEVLTTLKGYYDESYDDSKDRREAWKEYYKYWTNQSPSAERRSKLRSNIQVNYAYLITSIKTPVMTQQKPKATFLALNNTDGREKTAQILSKLVGNALWNKLKIQLKLVDVINLSIVYDAGFWKVGWDSNAEQGIGEVFVTPIEPFKIFSDPSATEIENSRYLIHAEVYPLSYLKDKYPKFKDQIKPDKKLSKVLFEERKKHRRTGSGVNIPVDSFTEFSTERGSLKEYWLAPTSSLCDLSIMEVVGEEEEEVEVPGTDEFGQPYVRLEKQKKEVKAPKYRNGRVVTVVNDTVIVDDKPNPFEHGRFPFVKQVISRVPNEFWGMGDVEQCIPLFDALNHAYQQIDDIVSQMCNLGYTVDPSIGEQNIKRFIKSLKQGIGQVKVIPLDKVKTDTPPVVPAYLFNRIKDLVQRIETITGITDVLQGKGGISHRTARGIERIYESATSRMGLATRLMEESLKDVAYLMASTAQQFYDTNRTFSVVGTSNNVEEVLTISKQDISGEFDVSIDSGASLPQDKKSKADLVFSLLQNHIFEMALGQDPIHKEIAKTVLDAVEYPGREAMLKNPVVPEQPAPPQGMMPGQEGVGQNGMPPLPPESIELLNILGSAGQQG